MRSRAVKDEDCVSGHKRSGRRSSVNDTLIEGFLRIHERVSDKLATPQRYISFIYTYMHIYTKKKTDIQQKQQRLQVQFVPCINFMPCYSSIVFTFYESTYLYILYCISLSDYFSCLLV